MIATQTIYEENLIKVVRTLPPIRIQQILDFALFLQTRSQEAEAHNALDFIQLPLAERRRLMAIQAEQMQAHYQQNVDERELWQGGDLVEYETP